MKAAEDTTSTSDPQHAPAEIDFIRACTGDDRAEETRESRVVLEHIRPRVQHSSRPFGSALCPEYHPDEPDATRTMRAFRDIVVSYRHRENLSVNRALQDLVERDVFRVPGTPEGEAAAKHCIFSAVGAASLLYSPALEQRQGCFEIDTQGARCFARNAVDIGLAARPVDELLRALGHVLPRAGWRAPGRDDPRQPSIKFCVSALNADVLRSLADVSIVWVDSIAAHLEFDPIVPALYLFRLPSFCKLHATGSSILSVLTREFYLDQESPVPHFSTRDLMTEIMLSYGLLFAHDARSRRLYRQRERDRARAGGDAGVDPLLDEFCGMGVPASVFSLWGSARETYDAGTDFPIFEGRLSAIQAYILGIQPGRLGSLWRDRRDLRLWYTIWAVIIIGGVTVILSTVQVILSAAQVALANKELGLGT